MSNDGVPPTMSASLRRSLFCCMFALLATGK